MFIIFGSPRSGTTLLASMLNTHSEIVVSGETDFIVPMMHILDRVENEADGRGIIKKLIVSTKRFPYSIGANLSVDEVMGAVDSAEYSASGILNAIYEKIATKTGKKISGDKSPNDISSVGLFRKTGILDNAEVRIIHMIRDVRDVVASLKNLGWIEKENRVFPKNWGQINLQLNKMLSHDSRRYALLKYEDLLMDPEKELKRIVNFLEVDFQDVMLDHEARNNTNPGTKIHEVVNKPLSLSSVGRWKKDLSDEDKRICSVEVRETLECFGYSV